MKMKIAATWLVVLFLAGCANMDEKNRTHILIYEQASETMPAHTFTYSELPSTGLKIPINRHPSLTDNDVDDAKLIQTAGGAAIMLRFDPHGMMRLVELTTRCRGQYLVIYLNDKPVAAWLCNKVLDKGQLLIEGDFTDEEAQKAVDSLKKESKKRRAL
jgi:preprotein translocase subunit SecD